TKKSRPPNSGRQEYRGMRLRRERFQAAAVRSLLACTDAKSSFECARVKMLPECRNECLAIDRLEPWYPANDWNIPVTLYSPTILRMIFSNHNHAVQVELCIADCHDCQQRMVDGAQSRPACNDDWDAKLTDQIQDQRFVIQRDQNTAGTFDD